MEEVIDKEMPKILVETWIALARSSEADQEVKMRALSMLKDAFESPQHIAEYMKKHRIK